MKRLKGFTLTELVVGMIIFIMIMAAATGILISSQGILIRQTEAVQEQKIGDAICQMIRLKLTHAKNMNITASALEPDKDDIYSEILYFRDGRVYFTARNDPSEEFYFDAITQDLYGNEFYNGLSVQVNIKNPAENLIDVTVELFDYSDKGLEASPCYSTDYNLLLSNMSDFGSGQLICEKNKTYTADALGTTGFYIYLE